MTTSCAISSSDPAPGRGSQRPLWLRKAAPYNDCGRLGQPRHHGRVLIVQTFDQQVTPVGLRDDLLMAEQAAQLTLAVRQRNVWWVKLACGSPRLRCAALQRIDPEAPFEQACRLIVLADELRGALAQMHGISVARMAQHPARVAGKPEFKSD